MPIHSKKVKKIHYGKSLDDTDFKTTLRDQTSCINNHGHGQWQGE